MYTWPTESWKTEVINGSFDRCVSCVSWMCLGSSSTAWGTKTSDARWTELNYWKKHPNSYFFIRTFLVNRLIWVEGGRSGENTRLPPPWPEFDSRTRRNMWVEFVVGSLLYSEGFFSGFSGFPSSAITDIPNSNSICVLIMLKIRKAICHFSLENVVPITHEQILFAEKHV